MLPPSVPQVVLSTNHTRVGVPDCEDAVYHPFMTALKWTTAVLVPEAHRNNLLMIWIWE